METVGTFTSDELRRLYRDADTKFLYTLLKNLEKVKYDSIFQALPEVLRSGRYGGSYKMDGDLVMVGCANF